MDCSICSKMLIASDDDNIALAVVRGVCQKHFLAQYVAPLQKERDNSQAIVDQLNSTIKSLLSELGQARRIEQAPARNRLLRTITGAYTNSTLVFCHKCWAPFDSGIDVIVHEETCRGSKPKRERTTQSRVARRPVDENALVDLGDSE